MQRRLTLALVLTALASIVLVGVGIVIMSRLGAQSDAERQIVDQLEAIGALSADSRLSVRELGPALERSRDAFDFELLEPVVVSDTGSISVIAAPGPRGGRSGRSPGPNAGDPELGSLLTLDVEQRAALGAGDTVVVFDNDRVIGVKALIGMDGTPIADRLDGVLALAASQRIVPLPRQVRTWLLLSSSLVLLGAVAAGLILGRRLVEPLRRIRTTTAAIAAGDLSARTAVTGTDEIGELGRSVNDMAAELDRSKQLDRQFLMSVSHDLRTPLTVIAGYAEALADATVSGTATTAAGRIIGGQARRLERLVGDLLDLARLDANRFQFDHRDVDAVVVAGRAVAGLRPRADELGISLDFDRPDDGDAPPKLRLDPDRLDQVVTNLVDNALRFARSAVTVTVQSRPGRGDPPTGPTIDIVVSDDGPGILADDLPHIFDRLYVGRGGNRGQENSTGLGLAIVRELTTAMGGTVEVESPTGGDCPNGTGTVFRLHFPHPSPPPTGEG